MKSKWINYALWTGAIGFVFLATIFYQPAAAKAGALLVLTNERLYVMDIDTLTLERVAPAPPGKVVSASPGCRGETSVPCRVVVGERLYRIDLGAGGSEVAESRLPIDAGYRWADSAVSWSPDGLLLAYSLLNETNGQSDLWIIDVSNEEVKLKADDVDPDVAIAWSGGCAAGFNSPDCTLGYKKMPGQQAQGGFLATLIGYNPATATTRQWSVTPERLYELRWSPDNMLLYSRPKRHFLRADDYSPAFEMPSGAQLANISPDAGYTVYYQPFTLESCQSDSCAQLGVWLQSTGTSERHLVYNAPLDQYNEGLNFIPTWTVDSKAFLFFQGGQMIHYDVTTNEGTIWYKGVGEKLRSLPVFSPNEEAVAFMDDLGQGQSNYRLLVINPRQEPLEHIIDTETGFRILAWLPN
jgi:hypothetical protein